MFTGPANIPSPVDSITAIQENGNNALDVMMAQLNSSNVSSPTSVIKDISAQTQTLTATPSYSKTNVSNYPQQIFTGNNSRHIHNKWNKRHRNSRHDRE